MRLEFASWISEQDISEDTHFIFGEAITCFRAEAYRAALLFSYLGFMAVLRQRILEAEMPASFSTREWSGICQNLRDDDKWEGVVFDGTQRKANQSDDKSIFTISNDLRKQVDYFKNRRNDCAHSKQNEIGYAHVESLWAFIQSNLSKFVVRGSSASLLEQIRKHYDPSITPSDTLPTNLVRQILQAVDPKDRQKFLEDLKVLLPVGRVPIRTHLVDFLSEIFAFGNDSLSNDLVQFLVKDEILLYSVIRKNPFWIVYFRGQDTIIRRLWYNAIPKGYFSRHSLEFLAILLSENLIPKEQQQQAIERVIRKASPGQIDDSVYELLKDVGVIDIYRRIAFVDPVMVMDFNWSTEHAEFLIRILDREGLDIEIASALSRALSQNNYPYQFCLELQKYFDSEPQQREDLLTLVRDNDLGEPTKLLEGCPRPY